MEENKKENVIIILLMMIIVLLLAVILYVVLKPNGKKNEPSQPNNNPTQVEDNKQTTGDNTQTADDNKVASKEEIVRAYKNYTSKTINDVWYSEKKSGTLKFEIKNGEFTVFIANKNIPVQGVNGKVKSFICEEDLGGYDDNMGYFIILLTEDNKLYFGEYIYELKNKYVLPSNVTFKNINSNLKFKNITYDAVYPHHVTEGVGIPEFYAVLDNNEIRYIDITQEGKIIIDDNDLSNYIKQYGNLLLTNDRKIIIDVDNFSKNTYLKYNNEELVVDKIYDDPKLDYSNYEGGKILYCYYIISSNKLYKLCGETEGYLPPYKFNKVELANNKTIKSVTANEQGEYYDQGSDNVKLMKFVITYTDNTKENIESTGYAFK